MDLSRPIRSAIPTLDGEALSVLAGTTAPLTGQRIARLADRGSRAGIQNALNRLVQHGIVLSEPAGSARVYVLNRDHLLADPLLALTQAREQLFSRLRSDIEGWRAPCLHASVFGSVARRDASAESDVDVLVVRAPDVASDDVVWQRQLTSLEIAVQRWTGNSLSWFETTLEGVRHAVAHGEPIVASWRNDSIQLSGSPLDYLLTDSTA